MMENDIKLGAEVDNNQERDNKKLELKIDGISCQACVAKIERKLSRTGGVEKALVNISNNMADIEYNEKEIKASEIMKINIPCQGSNPISRAGACLIII